MLLGSERIVALGDGASTAVTQWGESGPIVLCVHGIASSRRSWTRLGEALGSSRRVYAYDQRGHGDSAEVTGPMTLERSVADLHAVAATLPGPVDLLIGHSWGGAVAVLGGRALPAHKVVAIDPMLRVAPHTFASEYVDDLREPLALEPVAKEAAIREMYEGSHPTDIAGKIHAMLPMHIGALERLGSENRSDEGGWDIRESVASYPVPLLVLAAGEDSVLAADDLAFVRERGGPNVSVRVFEGHGHNLQRTAFDEFLRVVTAFA
jgi:pimeloyl-ACP methyl ester carboxylesterase